MNFTISSAEVIYVLGWKSYVSEVEMRYMFESELFCILLEVLKSIVLYNIRIKCFCTRFGFVLYVDVRNLNFCTLFEYPLDC